MNIQPIAVETDLTSATDVSGASVVRLNNTSTATLVTIKTTQDISGNPITPVTYASFTIAGGEIVLVQKDPSQTLEGGGTIKAVKVAQSK